MNKGYRISKKINRLYFLLIGIVVFSFLLNSCRRSEFRDMQKAVIVDYTGFDGCKFMIELKDGTLLRPYNLNQFDVSLEDNNKVWVKYRPIDSSGMVGICWCGEAIEIEDIRNR